MNVTIRFGLYRAALVDTEDVLAIQTDDHTRLTIQNATPGLRAAFRLIAADGADHAALAVQITARSDLPRLQSYLRQFTAMGRIKRSLYADDHIAAEAVPITPHNVRLHPFDPAQKYVLSRFAYLRREGGQMVLELPLANFQVRIIDSQALVLLDALNSSDPLAEAFRELLCISGMLTAVADDGTTEEDHDQALHAWKFHDRLFAAKTRPGGRQYRTATTTEPEIIPPPVKPPMSDDITPLDRPDIDTLRREDVPFTDVLEARRSVRTLSDTPISLHELGEFLYRTARIQTFVRGDYEATLRPYPAAGALHSLEIYAAVLYCDGLDAGLYHYCPQRHHLERLPSSSADLASLIENAIQMTGNAIAQPQILLIITTRFGRIAWKYADTALALTLKDVGGLFQTMYLVATAMRLAPCALGSGDAALFGEITKLNSNEEQSIAEFFIGK